MRRRRTPLLLGLASLAAAVVAAAAPSAPEPITIAAHPPDVLRDRRLTLFGQIPSERAEEIVRLEARDCGNKLWRAVAEVETSPGGRWEWSYFYPGISTSIRASWKGRTSAPVRVRDRVFVELRQGDAGQKWLVSVRAKMPFQGRRVLFQRLDPARGWTTLRTIVLEKSGVAPGSSYVYSTARFTASPRRGWLVRGFVPGGQAAPCYLQGRSNLLHIT